MCRHLTAFTGVSSQDRSSASCCLVPLSLTDSLGPESSLKPQTPATAGEGREGEKFPASPIPAQN